MLGKGIATIGVSIAASVGFYFGASQEAFGITVVGVAVIWVIS